MRKLRYLSGVLLFFLLLAVPYGVEAKGLLPRGLKKEVGQKIFPLIPQKGVRRGILSPKKATPAGQEVKKRLPRRLRLKEGERVRKLNPRLKKLRQRVELKEKLIEKRKTEFANRLKKIGDERKKKIVSRIADRLSALNKRLVERLENVSNKMLKIADKLEERANRLAKNGQDIKEIEAQLARFRQDVQTFQAKLEDQKGKAYIPALEEGKPLGQSVKTAVLSFVNDFKELRADVFNLRRELVTILKLFRSKGKAVPTSISTSSAGGNK